MPSCAVTFTVMASDPAARGIRLEVAPDATVSVPSTSMAAFGSVAVGVTFMLDTPFPTQAV